MSEPALGGSTGVPPGTFRIDREGAWRHEGQEVTHPGVLENLYANLRADGEVHYLQVGPVRFPVQVDDAPFVVTRVEAVSGPPGAPGTPTTTDPARALRIHLTGGGVEWLSPEGVWIDPRGTPYCRVKAGRFTARFSVPAWLQLAAFLEETPQADGMSLIVAGQRFPVPRSG